MPPLSEKQILLNKSLRVLSTHSTPTPLLENDPNFDPLVDSKGKPKHSLENSTAHQLAQEPDPARIANPLAEKSLPATIFFGTVVVTFLGWVYVLYSHYMKWCEDKTHLLPDTSIVNAGIPIFLVCILLEFVASLIMRYETYRLNDTTCSFSNGLFQTMLDTWISAMGEQMGVTLITAIPYPFIFSNYRLADIDGTLGFCLMFFARDFCYYWFHYWSHRCSFLWAVHGVHHRPSEFNMSVNLSQGAIQRITSMPFYLPLAFFFSPELYALLFPVEKIYGFLTHTKLVNKCYGISYFFVTPSSHRVHHGGRPAYVIDRNFGEMLTIWDRLFATFQEEQYPIVFGHVMPSEGWNPIDAQLETFRELYKKSQLTESWGKKLWCFLGPPAYNPVGEDYELLDSHPYNTVKYDAQLPQGNVWSLYTTVHHALTVAMGIAVLRNVRSYHPVALTVIMLYLTFSVSSIGRLWDGLPKKQRTVPVSLFTWEGLRLSLLYPMCLLTWGYSVPVSMNDWQTMLLQSAPFVLVALSAFVLNIFREGYRRSNRPKWVPEFGRRFKKQLEMEEKKSLGDGSIVSMINDM